MSSSSSSSSGRMRSTSSTGQAAPNTVFITLAAMSTIMESGIPAAFSREKRRIHSRGRDTLHCISVGQIMKVT
eukprot:11481184-Karenia_brevis.AAC.1